MGFLLKKDVRRPEPPAAECARPRVLLLAELCNPEWESIPLEGWSHSRALAKLVDLHLVTRSWNRPALLRAGLVEERDFTAIDTEKLFNPVQAFVRRVSGPNKGYALLQALALPSYLLLEHLTWHHFGPALRAGQFHLVHRLTPLSPAVPSPLATRCRRIGVPFVLGPINGGLPWPAGFPGLDRREGEWISRFRELHRWLPGYRSTREAASAIIVGSAGARADLPSAWHAKACYVPENGLDLARFPEPDPRLPGRPLRAVFLGRLVAFKGADMAIDAAAEFLADGSIRLEIIGEGPEQSALQAQVARLGLTQAVTFAGKVKHTELNQRLREADLLIFPSVREFGGAVVLEAMACGAVPIVVAFGGPGELTSPQTGFAVPLTDRAGVVAAVRQVLQHLVSDTSALPEMSRRAAQRARRLFSWDNKARQTLEVYHWVMGHRPDKPELPIPLPDPDPSTSSFQPLPASS